MEADDGKAASVTPPLQPAMKINRLAVSASPGAALSQRSASLINSHAALVGGETVAKLLRCPTAIIVCLMAISQTVVAAGVNLAWNANPETNITGYRVSYGTASGVYPNVVSVGTTPTTSISGLNEGTVYYFAVSAINQAGQQSPLSSQISYQIPVTTPTNQAPVATPASVSTNEDASLAIVLKGTDPENSLLTYSVVTSPTKGTLSGTAPNLTYSPSADYNGNDSFTFRVNDGSLNSSAATISITVNAVNDTPVATPKSVTTPEDTAVAVVLTGTDKDLNTLTYSVVTGPSNGTLTGTAPNLTYTPAANFSGSDQLTFRVSDGTVNSATATVSISVTPLNDPPVAQGKSVSTAEDTPVSVVLSGNDLENSPLTYTVVSGPSKGALSGTAPNLTYTPTADTNGNDSFTFRVNDGSQNSTIATISITVTAVNDTPVATPKSVTTSEDTAVAVVLTGSDKDLNALTFSVVTGPTNGTISGNPPNLTYTPSKDYNGSDQLTFRVNDGTASSTTATVTISVTPVNDPPLAQGKSVATTEDTPVSVLLAGTDLEISPLTYSIVSGPSKGALSGTAPNLTYTPSVDANGGDSFTYVANDGTANSAVATVSITINPVNDAPVAVAKSLTTLEDTALPIVLSGNDKDLNTLAFSIVTGPSKGTLTGTPPNLTYNPSKDFNGSDQFTFKVNDGTVDSQAATISILVSISNDAPVARADSLTTAEDTPLPIVLGGSDAEGATLNFTIVTGPTKGSLSGTLPDVTYSPTANQHGNDSFTFIVNDGASNSQPATISLTVTPVNDAPVANSLSVETPAGSPRSIVLTGSDPDGTTPTFAVIGNPAKGVLSGTPPNLSYQPNTGATGSDQFTYRASDGTLNSATATVSINITPVTTVVPNLAPVFTTNPISLNGTAGTSIGGQLAATDANTGDTLTFSKASGPAWLTVSSTGALGGTPQEADAGSNSFMVKVADNNGASSQAALNITVSSTTTVNRAPAFIGSPIYAGDASENAAYTGQSLAGQAVDPDTGDLITYWKISGPEWLNVALNGELSGTPPSGSAGTNGFVIRAADSSLATADVELRINVVGLPLPWKTTNVGTGQTPGLASYLNGSYTQTGSGALGGSSDKTHFTYQTLSGDGSIVAKVRLAENSGPACFTGIMIRENLGPRAREVFLGLTNDSSYRLVSRTKAGRRASVKSIARDASPDTWVRLIRNKKKGVIFSYKSPDGINWTYLGAARISLPTTCYIGLAVSSGSDSTRTVGTFSNLYVDP